MKKIKFLIGAGGTGGHLFPALAVVEKLLDIAPDSEFYFAGREDKIEGEIIPAKGFHFVPIQVDGFQGLSLNSLAIPFKILRAKAKLNHLIRKENIDAVICTGAYISYAPGLAAKSNKIPLFLLESNVNPGKTISLLSNSASKIFTSYEKSSGFFNPAYLNKIVCTGNPLRKSLEDQISREEALTALNLPTNQKTLLIFGGSLGARSINQATEANINELLALGINVIWQTGKNYAFSSNNDFGLLVLNFIDDMQLAYSAADLVLCRSGATTVAELANVGKPSILVPLPSASNNEQFMNAQIYQDNKAAILIEDNSVKSKMYDTVKKLINDNSLLEEYAIAAHKLAKPDAARAVAKEIIYYLDEYGK